MKYTEDLRTRIMKTCLIHDGSLAAVAVQRDFMKTFNEHTSSFDLSVHKTIPSVVTLAVRWPSIPKVALSRPTGCSKSCDLWPALPPCKWSSGCTALCRVEGNDQSIGSTVSAVIVRSLLWSTATGSSPFGYFSSITASSC